MLVAARFLQGVGGALASSVILAMIVTMFEEPPDRARAMAVFGFSASAGGSIGLLAGGTLTELVNWHCVFLVNVPIGIAAIMLAVRFLKPGTAIGFREGADALGALLNAASLMLAGYTVVEIPAQGATSAHTFEFAALCLALCAAFIARQATAAKPLLSLGASQ